MATARVTSKGQVVIPVEIRKKLDIKKGTRLYFEERGDEVVLRAINRKYIESLAGILQTGGELTRSLLEDRAEDREREDSDDYESSGHLRPVGVSGKRTKL